MISSIVKILIRVEFEYTPTLYEKETKKIKNKRIRSALQLNLSNFVVDQGNELLREKIT